MARNDIFTKVETSKVKSNVFDLSHDVKLSLNMGELIPTNIIECIPGDKFNISTESLLRFAPLAAPVMHSINVYTHYFFVPNRLLWPNWEKFITANNGSDVVPAPPTLTNFTSHVGDISDYLGLPTGVSINEPVSMLPHAAYQKIYDEFYRDQNLEESVWKPLVDGNNGAAGQFEFLLQKRRRAWEHDYFTSALPWAQKGEAVTLPLGNSAPVIFEETNQPVYWRNTNGSNIPGGSATPFALGDGSDKAASGLGLPAPAGNYGLDPNGSLRADLTDATASTINDLRRAFRLQEWLEKMARGGSRYIEQIAMHFGVKSSDARLQRPQFLGGTKQPVVISEVLQTSESAESPQGTMAGHGISVGSGKNISYTCEEHGYIIGIMSIMPKTAYQQGIPRHFSRTSYLDYAWPTFAHIGEQEILNKEVYYGGDADDNKTFGYIPRYSEYRYQPSRVAGEFRTTLAFWHLGRIFGSRPNLNAQFIKCVPRDDIFAVSEEAYDQNIWAHVFHRVSAVRKLPKYGTPQL